MTLSEKEIIAGYCLKDKWNTPSNILAYLDTLPLTEEAPKGTRTSQQNRALHKDCSLIAEKLEAAGKDWKAIIKEGVDVPVTGLAVKELLWRPVMKLLYGYDSTRDLKKIGEIDRIHEVVLRTLMEKHHIEWHDFPHDPDKQKEEMGGYKTNAGNSKGYEYPEYEGAVVGLD